MPSVKLYNDNTQDYEEKFRGEMIRIPANGFVEMERSKAIAFKGALPGVDRELGILKVKKLRMEEDPHQRALRLDQPLGPKHLCQACGKDFLSARELETHIDVHHSKQKVAEEVEEKGDAKPKSRPKGKVVY